MKTQCKSMINSTIGVLFVIVCVMSVNLHAQSDNLLQNSDLKRHNFRLALEGRPMMILEKDQLQTMLSSEQFRGYNHARRCYIASIPLLSLVGCYATLGGIFLGTGETLGVFVSYIYFGAAFACLVPGVVLMVHSAKRINNIADTYNNQRHSSYFQNGLQINYGFVGNGIGVNLRF